MSRARDLEDNVTCANVDPDGNADHWFAGGSDDIM